MLVSAVLCYVHGQTVDYPRQEEKSDKDEKCILVNDNKTLLKKNDKKTNHCHFLFSAD